MTSTGTARKKTPSTAPVGAAAVLYVCAQRSTLTPGLAAERALEEGRALAREQELTLLDVIEDEYGEPDPCQREGWLRVRELAASRTIDVVIVRWPAAIAPQSSHELRHREVQWLRDRGTRVRYSWSPLTDIEA